MINASSLRFKKHQSIHRAIVVGGSISGLLAARVLLNHFEQVILIERDELQTNVTHHPQARPGVPQSPHVHVLLVQGHRLLESLFPGITAELKAAGAPALDWFSDWMALGPHGWRPQGASDLHGSVCSSDLLASCIRQRLFQDSRCSLLQGCQVEELQYQPETKRVTGVRVQRCQPTIDSTSDSTSEWLSADLVVDASGRSSALPQWLSQLGYAAPEETIVNAFLGYATRWFEPPSSFEQNWQGITLYPKPGENSRGGVLYTVEGNRWIVTLAGIGQDYPPTDAAGFLEFAQNLRHPILSELIQQAKPLTPIYSYRRTENRLLHYDRITLPDGIVAMGDAVCTFNPIYGQGMTTAALGAIALDRCLAKHGNRKGLTARFQKQFAKVITVPWLMATGEDSRWSVTVGAKSSQTSRWVQAYINRVLLVGMRKPEVFRAFLEVLHLVKFPTVLLQPFILLAVLRSLWDASFKTDQRTKPPYEIRSPQPY